MEGHGKRGARKSYVLKGVSLLSNSIVKANSPLPSKQAHKQAR